MRHVSISSHLNYMHQNIQHKEHSFLFWLYQGWIMDGATDKHLDHGPWHEYTWQV
jgi:hypothetical protein